MCIPLTLNLRRCLLVRSGSHTELKYKALRKWGDVAGSSASSLLLYQAGPAFEPNVLQLASHVEPIVPVSVFELRFVLESFYCVLRLGGDRNERLDDMKRRYPEWPQRGTPVPIETKYLILPSSGSSPQSSCGITPHLQHRPVHSSARSTKFLVVPPTHKGSKDDAAEVARQVSRIFMLVKRPLLLSCDL